MIDLEFVSATPERWPLIEWLFRDVGDARHCWCAYWYRPNRDYRGGKGEGNRAYLQAMVEAGREPGVLALRGEEPLGWCGIGPRARQERLDRSRILAAVDAQPVWSITCFVIAKSARRQGLMRPLIKAAVDLGRRQGARLIEAYPLDKAETKYPPELYVGTAAAFRDQGFVEVARRSPHRPIMRRSLDSPGAEA